MFTAQASSLCAILKRAFIDKQSSSTILRTVRLEVVGRFLTVTSFDDGTTLRDVVPDGGGTLETVCVEAESLLKAVTGEKGAVSLTNDLNILRVTVGGVDYALATDDRDKFPVSSYVFTTKQTVIGLQSAFEGTHYAICHEQSRYAMNGAFLRMGKGIGEVVATDGHILAAYQLEATTGQARSVLIPSAVVEWVRKHGTNTATLLFVDGEEPPVKIDFQDGRTLEFQPINGQFPYYEAVYPDPKKAVAWITFESGRTLSAELKRVTKMDEGKFRPARFCVSPTDLHIEWIKQGKEGKCEHASIQPAIERAIANDGVSVSLNCAALQGFLSFAGEAPVTMTINDKTSPVAFKVKGNDSLYFIAMPCRL